MARVSMTVDQIKATAATDVDLAKVHAPSIDDGLYRVDQPLRVEPVFLGDLR